jgi:hypothetical protein
MSWCPICMLLGLLLFYAGGSITVIVVVAINYKFNNPSTVTTLVFIGILSSIVITGIIYCILRACCYNDERIIPQQQMIDIPMSTNVKSGTIIEHPTGELEFGITK